jgi:hypothetical protein
VDHIIIPRGVFLSLFIAIMIIVIYPPVKLSRCGVWEEAKSEGIVAHNRETPTEPKHCFEVDVIYTPYGASPFIRLAFPRSCARRGGWTVSTEPGAVMRRLSLLIETFTRGAMHLNLESWVLCLSRRRGCLSSADTGIPSRAQHVYAFSLGIADLAESTFQLTAVAPIALGFFYEPHGPVSYPAKFFFWEDLQEKLLAQHRASISI